MVECLVNACGDNWDLAWELVPEDDYLTGTVENYDEVTHQVVAKRNLDGRAVRGVLFFVRLHKEMAEVAERFATRQAAALEGETPVAATAESGRPLEPAPDPKRVRRRADKRAVAQMAQEGDIDGLVRLCLDDHKVLRFLQRLLYDPDPASRYRIAWLLGQVSGRVAGREPGPVADLLHRLFEACADSAATSWGMVEAIGAIIAARPDIYGAFTRHLFNYMGDPGTREAVLWGLGEIAAVKPQLVRQTPFYSLFPVLGHSDPVLRGLTLRLLGRIGAREAGLQMLPLQHDASPITIYEQGRPVDTTVAELYAEANRIMHKEKTNGE
jgi:hypothetical protein